MMTCFRTHYRNRFWILEVEASILPIWKIDVFFISLLQYSNKHYTTHRYPFQLQKKKIFWNTWFTTEYQENARWNASSVTHQHHHHP